MGNAGLGFLSDEIKNRSAGRFRSGASGRRDCNKWGERFRDWQTLTERRIDEVKELGIGKVGVEVHQLRCIDDTAAPDCQERVWSIVLREVDCLLDSE